MYKLLCGNVLSFLLHKCLGILGSFYRSNDLFFFFFKDNARQDMLINFFKKAEINEQMHEGNILFKER